MTKVRVINKNLLDEVSTQAKTSPRLRMNYNFHQSLDDKCHRMLNAVETGTDIPIHRHPDKDESFVILRGKVRSTTYNDDGSVIDSVVLSQKTASTVLTFPKASGTNSSPSNPPASSSNAKKGRIPTLTITKTRSTYSFAWIVRN